MTDMSQDQRQFMYNGNQSIHGFNYDQTELYHSLVQEESKELLEALQDGTNDEILKEAMDVIVVTLGLVWSMGVDPSDVWKLVHKNNMSKVSNQDAIVKDSNGKILKSEASKLAKQKMMSDIRGLLNVHSG